MGSWIKREKKEEARIYLRVRYTRVRPVPMLVASRAKRVRTMKLKIYYDFIINNHIFRYSFK